MQVLVRLGWGHSYSNDIPRAIALFNQAMRIARRLEDKASIGTCYFGLGRAYRFVSEIRIARDQYSSALDYFRQVGSWRELAESYFNIGNIDFREGDYRNALQSIKQALAIIGDRNEHELLGRAYNDLALIYDNVELPTARALAAWEKCIDHFQKAGNNVSPGHKLQQPRLPADVARRVGPRRADAEVCDRDPQAIVARGPPCGHDRYAGAASSAARAAGRSRPVAARFARGLCDHQEQRPAQQRPPAGIEHAYNNRPILFDERALGPCDDSS